MFGKIRLALQVASAVGGWIKEVRQDAHARLSPERAQRDRLWLERVAANLAEGKVENLPKWLRAPLKWITLNNTFGRYAQVVLKSDKLAKKDAVLYTPVYPAH